jgi:hypothetical protein
MAFQSSGSDWARRSGESIGKFYRYPRAMIDRTALEQLAGRHLAAMDELPRDPGGASIFTLTAREPENRSTIGFHTQWTAKKPS